MPVRLARSRREVQCLISVGADKRRREDHSASGTKPKSEFVRGTLGAFKQECLSKLILFGEGPLSRVLSEYSLHGHNERNHQGMGNRLLSRI